jgi:hypothetical protein
LASGRTDPRSGQSLVEYLFVLAIVMGCFLAFYKGLKAIEIGKLVARPITTQFAASYRYGHPKAKGFDEGGPEFLPHAPGKSGNNFRLFVDQAAP